MTLRAPTVGDLGWVLHRHATLYAAEFGWDASFEELCARIIAEYTTLRDAHPDRAAGWIAEVDGVPAGSVFCVPDSETTARLRLLLVEPWARGLGLGARLVGQCLRVRPRGRLRRHHPVDLRPPGRRPQGLPGGRVHPGQRVPRRRVRPPHDEPDLGPLPLTAVAVSCGEENRGNLR